MLAFVSRTVVGRCCRIIAECPQQHQIAYPSLLTSFRSVHDATNNARRIKEKEKRKKTPHATSIPSAGNTSEKIPHPTSNESDGNSSTKVARPLSYYNNLGIRQRKVDQLIRRCRESEGVVSADVKRMGGFIETLKEYNFTEEDVSLLIMRKPQIFDMPTKNLKKRIDSLIQFGYLEITLKKVIMKDPNLLVYDEKKASIPARLKILQELDVYPRLDRDTAFYLMQKCPKLLSVRDVSVLNSRIYNLISYGLNEKQMYKLLRSQPSFLLQKESTLNPKLDYMTNMLGAPSGLFVKCPRALTQSLRRIKERHLYLVKENMFQTGSGRRLTENQLRALVLTSDEVFVTHVTKTNMEDFKQFQQQIWEKGNTKEESRITEDSDSVSGDESSDHTARDFLDHDESDEDFLDHDEGDDFLDHDEGDEDLFDYNEYDDDLENDGVDQDDIDSDDFDVQEKRRYLASFGTTNRPRKVTEEEWYNTPFPEIKPPETDAGSYVNQRHRFDSKSRRKSFHRYRRR